MNLKKICINCMKEKPFPDASCPYCGFHPQDYIPENWQLPPMTPLNGKYLLGKVLGTGGFGITYIAYDVRLQMPVAVKELFLKNISGRNIDYSIKIPTSYTYLFEENKRRFLQEARTLARFRENDGVVSVKDTFEENNTVYIVMEYLAGETLKQRVEKAPLTYKEVKRFIGPIASALQSIHRQGVLHLDVSPDNIMILSNHKVKLLDFGGAKVMKEDQKKFAYRKCYTPIEQRQEGGLLGPWTDEYALAATIYYCLTGEKPMDAAERICRIAEKKPMDAAERICRTAEKKPMDAAERICRNAEKKPMDAAERICRIAEKKPGINSGKNSYQRLEKSSGAPSLPRSQHIHNQSSGAPSLPRSQHTHNQSSGAPSLARSQHIPAQPSGLPALARSYQPPAQPSDSSYLERSHHNLKQLPDLSSLERSHHNPAQPSGSSVLAKSCQSSNQSFHLDVSASHHPSHRISRNLRKVLKKALSSSYHDRYPEILDFWNAFCTAERSTKRARILTWTISILFAVSIGTGLFTGKVLIPEVIIPAQIYAEAESYLQSEKYIEAYQTFKSLKDYKNAQQRAEEIQTSHIGYFLEKYDIITFGRYPQTKNRVKEPVSWLVLKTDVENRKVLLISEKALACHSFNFDDHADDISDMTWAESDLEKWLNQTFLENAFTLEEQSIIRPATLNALNNPTYQTSSGKETAEAIFLLSYEEAGMLFESDEKRCCKATAYAVKQGGEVDEEGRCSWWLRTQGRYAWEVTVVTAEGKLDDVGNSVGHESKCVRPALWIDIDEITDSMVDAESIVNAESMVDKANIVNTESMVDTDVW